MMNGSRDVMFLDMNGMLPGSSISHLPPNRYGKNIEISHPIPNSDPLPTPYVFSNPPPNSNSSSRPLLRKSKDSCKKYELIKAAKNIWRCGCLFMTILLIALSVSMFILIYTSKIVFFYKQMEEQSGECAYSCLELLDKGHNKSGVYPLCGSRCDNYVYCDQVSDGGGWLVIQRRIYGNEDFSKPWDDYKDGFGEIDGDFWYGNKKILKLANNSTRRELRFDMCDLNAVCVYATYTDFYLDGPANKYTLHFLSYSGTAGDSLSKNKDMKFSTIDQDNDMVDSHCSEFRGNSGWWYNRCGDASPNGIFNNNKRYAGINWKTFKPNDYSLPFMEMKIR